MATMDIFNNDAFGMVELTEAVEKVPYQPMRLGQLGIFSPRPVRTETVAVEQREGTLNLIQTSERGAPLDQRNTEKRDIRDFRTVRIAKGDTIYASEIQGIRQFGSETEMMQVQQEIARRLGGPTGLRAEVELTKEHMRLGAIQGQVLDADGSTIRDWYSEFGVSQPAAINFALGTSTTNVRQKCNQVIRAMQKAAKGAWTPGTYVHALCGDAFFDSLTNHQAVRETFLNQQEASELRNNWGLAYQSVRFGNILFENYRGTDDGSTVGIPTDECKFFPVNAPGVFVEAMSPAESFDFVNTPGRDIYAMIIPDEKRNQFVELEVYSYPLHICTRPLMLQRATRT